MPTARVQTVRRAAEIIGGLDASATALGVPVEDAACYLLGTKEIPIEVFHRATEIVLQASEHTSH